MRSSLPSAIALTAAALAALPQAPAGPAQAPAAGPYGPPPGPRVLHFPEGRAVGDVSWADWRLGTRDDLLHSKHWSEPRPARGEVRVPAGKQVYVRLYRFEPG